MVYNGDLRSELEWVFRFVFEVVFRNEAAEIECGVSLDFGSLHFNTFLPFFILVPFYHFSYY